MFFRKGEIDQKMGVMSADAAIKKVKKQINRCLVLTYSMLALFYLLSQYTSNTADGVLRMRLLNSYSWQQVVQCDIERITENIYKTSLDNKLWYIEGVGLHYFHFMTAQELPEENI